MLIEVELPRGTSKDEAVVEALVTRVHDGDTSSEKDGNVRLLGCDAPELQQAPWGTQSRDWLTGRIKGKTVKLILDSKAGNTDKYGRLLRWISLDEIVINQELVVLGLAVPYMLNRVSPVYGMGVERAGEIARTEKRGVWADPSFVLPSVWRKQK